MKKNRLVTESDSYYEYPDRMSTLEILTHINGEDAKVAATVSTVLPFIEKLIDMLSPRFEQGGRLFYVGSGTSGRLGIVDASECPPTFGIAHDRVIGIIAGGDSAIRKAVEFAEDDSQQGWKDIMHYQPDKLDTVVGISASGTTPYVLGAIKEVKKRDLLTAGIVCNKDSELAKQVDVPIEVVVGSEFITGSTRMKSGTAQKMILNMISTTLMIKQNRIKGNKMVDMQLTNNKLKERGANIIATSLSVDMERASSLLEKYGSVRSVLDKFSHS